MNEELIKEYSHKYKKHQVRLTYILAVLIALLGVACIAVGLILAIYKFETVRCVIGCLVVLAGILDIALAIKFGIESKKRVLATSDKDAAIRYSRITGAPLTKEKK